MFPDRECSNCDNIWTPTMTRARWGRFTSENVFTDGIASEYKLIFSGVEVPLVFSKGDYLCDKCIKTLNCEHIDQKECDNCHEHYNNCAYCASMISDLHVFYGYAKNPYIKAGYGSSYDGLSIYFTTTIPENLSMDSTICDKCIKKFIDDKTCYMIDDNSDESISDDNNNLEKDLGLMSIKN
jgi:hypothetical protein